MANQEQGSIKPWQKRMHTVIWTAAAAAITSLLSALEQRGQALTTPEIFRLPIGQPAGKNQVAPIKIQVAPIRQAPGWWFYAVWQNEISVEFAAK